MTEQDLRVAKRIIPRLLKASVILHRTNMPEEERAACNGAIADACRLLGSLLTDSGIAFDVFELFE
jgi:hypothetical protein